jgi:hypothetical protein
MKLISLLSLALVIGSFSTGFAQKKDAKKASRIIRIDSVKVEGRIQKPEAFYILQRSELNFEGLEPKKSFVPLIIKSVDKEPF